ncbi:MAG: LacI family transcriptional regulator [Hyphomicrobiales bacterium]|nr:LacI family transcriptional regulator [Hyphomicrobiales bacterium]
MTGPTKASGRPKKPTAQDVAELAGVSPSTVSLVLQNKGSIPEDTREKVRWAVDQTGYERPRVARSARKTQAIAVVVEDIENPYFAELYSGIDLASDEKNRLSLLLSSKGAVDRQVQLLRDVQEIGCAGAILVPVDGSANETREAIGNLRLPVVLGVRRLDQGAFDYVGPDYFQGMQLATRHLLGLGHRKITFAGGLPNNSAFAERLGGFRISVASHTGGEVAVEEMHGPITSQFGVEAMEAILARPDRSTAVIGYNDQVAFGLMSAARENGLTPGKDIAIVGFDDVKASALRNIPLTTISTPPPRLGQELVRLLEARIAEPDADPVSVILPPALKIRESCCPPK